MNRLFRLFTLQWLLTLLSHAQASSSAEGYHLNYQAFLWDESCTDWPNPNNQFAAHGETKQDGVAIAFEGALELAADAWNRFNTTAALLNDTNKANDDSSDSTSGVSWLTQEIIDEDDPAYVQFFKLNWESEPLDFISQIWTNMNRGINEQPGNGARPSNAYLKILCQSIHIPSSTGVDECSMGNNIITRNEKNADGDYQGTYMNFCDGFFSQPRFDVRKAAAAMNATAALAADTYSNGEPAVQKNWEAVRRLVPGPNNDGNTPTDAGSIVHDLTHIYWIGPTNSPATWVNDTSITAEVPEVFGWWTSMNLCCSAASYEQPAYIYNAANYQWYAEVGYWDNRWGEIWPVDGKWKKRVQVGESDCSTAQEQ